MGLPSSCSCSQFRFPYNYTKSKGQQIRKDTGDARLLCRAISNEHYVKGIVLGNSEFNSPESAALTVRLTKQSFRQGRNKDHRGRRWGPEEQIDCSIAERQVFPRGARG